MQATTRCCSSSSTGEQNDSSKAAPKVYNYDTEGEVELYHGPQPMTCRAMVGAGVFNFAYWSWYLFDCWYNAETVLQGVSIGGNPMWGYAGATGTGLIFYSAYQYATHTVYRSYETRDGKRLGFQLHTILGFPGRKIEVMHGNAAIASRAWDKKDTEGNALFKGTNIPVTVVGMDKNILIDGSQDFFHDRRLEKLLGEAAAARERDDLGLSDGAGDAERSAALAQKQARVDNLKADARRRRRR